MACAIKSTIKEHYMYKILIVEDELIAAEYLKIILEKRGWEVVNIVDNATDALQNVYTKNPHLVLMDIMLKGSKSGCEIALDIRKMSQCCIVFTTAYADDEMINYAMDIKADGYIIKPYDEKEIIATVSLLSARRPCFSHNKICKLLGGFYFNYETNLLYKENNSVKVGPKALKLLQALCANRNTHVTYETLYQALWNDEINLKKLQMVIYRIREVCGVDFIENLNGIGYQIQLDHAL